MQIDWHGKTYEFDFDAIDVQQATVIKQFTGMAIVPWQNAISEADPQALQALLWCIKQQNGEKTAITGIKNFRPMDLLNTLNDSILAERALEDDADVPDPTRAASGPDRTTD